jgi:Na+-transporting NADH:ubiquinone oxidoreductase subunit F
MLTVALGFLLFTGIVFALVCVLLIARRLLVDVGPVDIQVNDDPTRTLRVEAGGTLLATLASQGILVPSACGGKGTCGACRVQVLSGAGPTPAVEESVLGRAEARRGFRLACQVKVRNDLRIALPAEVLSVRRWRCRVVSNRNVATFIKETVLELPAGETIAMQPGSFVQVECPPYQLSYAEIAIDERFAAEWDRLNLRRLRASNDETTERAYSMANYPGEDKVILNVRIALPPLEAAEAPPGIVSSYLFSLKPGDEVTISGAYGNFHACDTEREMCFVGGGAGMAPMRSHVFNQLLCEHTARKITYWYGARSLAEAFYVDEFDDLARRHDNFEWHLALSEPLPQDQWRGPRGFIHQVLLDQYLSRHPNPEEIEFYLCGPPAMLAACRTMLDELGVPEENVFFDDFGT